MTATPPTPDVLAVGICCRGRHPIRDVSDTITRRDLPGRYCRACWQEMDDEQAGIDAWLEHHDDATYIDEIAVAEAISGQRQQRMRLRPQELDQAVLRLRLMGLSTPQVAQRLFVSESTVWLVLRRCEGQRLDAAA